MNRRVLLKTMPKGKLKASDFEMDSAPMPRIKPGQVLLKTLYLSLDAASRVYMQGVTYRDAIVKDHVMTGLALARVLDSLDPDLTPGDVVEAETGWQEYAVMPARKVTKRQGGAPLHRLMSAAGISGRTAYVGMTRICRPAPGETVVVSAAAGGVGMVAGQLAKLAGARVVGIAGGQAKCRWLLTDLGFDAAIDYKSEDVGAALAQACPNGIDAYFDNVGGEMFEAVLFKMRDYGRIACCGVLSHYDSPSPGPGVMGVPGLFVAKRLQVQGFIVSDFVQDRAAIDQKLDLLLSTGKLKDRVDILNGIDQAPAGLVGMLAGNNTGKRLIRVDPDII